MAPVMLVGCAGNSLNLSPQPFEGPPIALDSAGGRHVVKVTSPTSGWALALDRTRRQFDTTEVFITMTRPNPAYMHAQAEVVQNLDSTVASKEPVVVYARVFDFGKRDPEAPFRQAAKSGQAGSP